MLFIAYIPQFAVRRSYRMVQNSKLLLPKSTPTPPSWLKFTYRNFSIAHISLFHFFLDFIIYTYFTHCSFKYSDWWRHELQYT